MSGTTRATQGGLWASGAARSRRPCLPGGAGLRDLGAGLVSLPGGLRPRRVSGESDDRRNPVADVVVELGQVCSAPGLQSPQKQRCEWETAAVHWQAVRQIADNFILYLSWRSIQTRASTSAASSVQAASRDAASPSASDRNSACENASGGEINFKSGTQAPGGPLSRQCESLLVREIYPFRHSMFWLFFFSPWFFFFPVPPRWDDDDDDCVAISTLLPLATHLYLRH